MNNGTYFIGGQRYVVNDHTDKEERARIELKLKANDNNNKKSNIVSESLPESKQVKPRGKRKPKI